MNWKHSEFVTEARTSTERRRQYFICLDFLLDCSWVFLCSFFPLKSYTRENWFFHALRLLRQKELQIIKELYKKEMKRNFFGVFLHLSVCLYWVISFMWELYLLGFYGVTEREGEREKERERERKEGFCKLWLQNIW